VDGWRELARVERDRGDQESSVEAMLPIALLDAATPDELMSVKSRRARVASARPGMLGDAGLRRVQSQQAFEHPAAELIAAISTGLGKVFPNPLEQYSVGRRDRFRGHSGQNEIALIDRVATVLGVSEYEVYFHDAPAGDVTVEPLSPPTLLVPRWFRDLGAAEQAFLAGRALAYTVRELHPLLRIGSTDLPLMLAAATRCAVEGYNGGLPDAEVDARSRQIAKGIPRRARRLVELAAAKYAATPLARPADWQAAVELSCLRVALLICDDVGAAVSVIRRFRDERAEPLVLDLLRFWASDDARSFRRAVSTEVAAV
jgi:hypothetical protein